MPTAPNSATPNWPHMITLVDSSRLWHKAVRICILYSSLHCLLCLQQNQNHNQKKKQKKLWFFFLLLFSTIHLSARLPKARPVLVNAAPLPCSPLERRSVLQSFKSTSHWIKQLQTKQLVQLFLLRVLPPHSCDCCDCCNCCCCLLEETTRKLAIRTDRWTTNKSIERTLIRKRSALEIIPLFTANLYSFLLVTHTH